MVSKDPTVAQADGAWVHCNTTVHCHSDWDSLQSQLGGGPEVTGCTARCESCELAIARVRERDYMIGSLASSYA